ncbi:MAG: pyridoxine 5'-phosphate synthase [Cyanobacteria bacterium HKST-UBA04]|nr:pyridoxine 5'-phosphate synthase [Cyanobacteria bacterium HKST-UBA05]MCA9797919.1 pyridoxine 5'-phosphate synthase [Cyanobacteria bacterium HKST-UBA04]
MVLLGVNIDHVATVRNARGGLLPDPVDAARIAEAHGADGITVHLREDRRHIKDMDLTRLRQSIATRLNLEMAATPEMVDIALDTMPEMVTLVPERRQELTTEGGLDVIGQFKRLGPFVCALQESGIPVSLFVDPNPEQVSASADVGAACIELHTGDYAHAWHRSPNAAQQAPLRQLFESAELAHQLGLMVNAGHGLDYENVKPVIAMPHLHELNIGHSIVAHAIMVGLGDAVAQMKVALGAPVSHQWRSESKNPAR